MISFVVPGLPPSLNQWSRQHWSKRAKIVADWKWRVKAAVHPRGACIPGRVHVTLTFVSPRVIDVDNYVKAILDSLKGQCIDNDDGATIASLMLRWERGPKAVRVLIRAAG